MARLTQKRIRELLYYDPEIGYFIRLSQQGNQVEGAIAGGVDDQGYVRIRIGRSRYKAHRLAWKYMTGSWPRNQLDHINGQRADNCWTNLREATNAENQQNQRQAKASNKSGLLGVVKPLRGRGWNAFIKPAKGKQIYLGYFASKHEAHAAYLAAKATLHSFSVLS